MATCPPMAKVTAPTTAVGTIATREVAAARRWSMPSSQINSGTITEPPPTPKKPERTPPSTPTTTSNAQRRAAVSAVRMGFSFLSIEGSVNNVMLSRGLLCRQRPTRGLTRGAWGCPRWAHPGGCHTGSTGSPPTPRELTTRSTGPPPTPRELTTRSTPRVRCPAGMYPTCRFSSELCASDLLQQSYASHMGQHGRHHSRQPAPVSTAMRALVMERAYVGGGPG